jgi:hypothetical protein
MDSEPGVLRLNEYAGGATMKRREEGASVSEFVLGQMSPEEALQFLDEVERDPELSAEVEDCVMVARVAEECGGEVFTSAQSGPWLVRENVPTASGIGLVLRRAISFRSLAIACVLLLLLGVPWLSDHVSGPYSDLAVVTEGEVDVPMRGVDDGRLTQIKKLLHAGRYDEAITLLEEYVQNTPTAERRAYAAYLLGGAYLISARKSYLGFFAAYDDDRVALGMGYLMEVVRNGGEGRLVQEARWLRAKGYLMIGHPDAAVGEATEIVVEGGSKTGYATGLLADIRRAKEGK